ncbi:30S ribosomal protein S17 [bacterium]|jgi:small subunit ribosomal protein S17|nr:30S ribosomal protein S17 [bacterium]NBX78747.1 30S ribosomal protein S17 [bacterium]
MAEVNQKMLTGTVVSDKMQKTVVVEYVRAFKHQKFNKIIRVSKKYKVHDEQELAKVGDKIEFYEGRPVSKTKYMYLHRIV